MPNLHEIDISYIENQIPATQLSLTRSARFVNYSTWFNFVMSENNNSLLQFLLGDIPSQYFFSEIYNKRPLHVSGASSKFSHLFSLDVLNAILNFSSLQYPRIRVTDHFNTIHKYDLIDDKDRYSNNLNNELNRKKILFAIARGGTLVYDRIQEFHLPLERFIDQLSEEINTRMSINGYYTARQTKGVNVHFDRHDVFAIQIHGSKRWFYRRRLMYYQERCATKLFHLWMKVLLGGSQYY
jgi:ribosomal protein L16 Arg81 hydroxylase